ncbi:MAG: hypothetical protein QW533_06560 [Thermoplasmata archaeon]
MKYVFEIPPASYEFAPLWHRLIREWKETNRRDDVELFQFPADADYKYIYPNIITEYEYYADEFKYFVGRMRDGDVLFFEDIQNPYIFIADYIRRLNGMKIEIRALFIDMSRTMISRFERVNMKYIENGAMHVADKIYFPDVHFRGTVKHYYLFPYSKTVISGIPIDGKDIVDGRTYPKKYNFLLFDNKHGLMKKYMDKLGFSYTTAPMSEIPKAKVVLYAEYTSYPYPLIKALASNVPPVTVDFGIYRDILPSVNRGRTFWDMLLKVNYLIHNPDTTADYRPLLDYFNYRNVFNVWLD